MKSNAKGQNHIVAKPKVTEEDCLSITSKVTEPSHRLKLVNRLRSSVWLTAREERRLVRMRLRFKIDTGSDVTIITKKIWLAMKDKPRLEPTAVRLNSTGGQLKAFGQLM